MERELNKWNNLFDLLPKLETGNPARYEMQDKIIQAVRELQIDFDWPKWEKGKQIMNNSSADYSQYDTETLAKLLYTIVRADRFNEGLLRLNLKNGNVIKIIKALKNKVA